MLASLSIETIAAKVGAAAEVPPIGGEAPWKKNLKKSDWAETSGKAWIEIC